MYDDFQVISNNLKMLREKCGLTQEQLSDLTDLSVSHISKVETGQRRVGMKTYIKILRVLEARDSDFVSCTFERDTDQYLERYLDIVADCNEDEKKFLLNSLENLKIYLRDLKISTD